MLTRPPRPMLEPTEPENARALEAPPVPSSPKASPGLKTRTGVRAGATTSSCGDAVC